MGFKRQLSKPDATTQKIVDELRAIGFDVIYVNQPVDLLVTHPTWSPNTWRLLEVKSHRLKNGEAKLDKRQQAQRDFCELHSVPYVTDSFEALKYLRGATC